VHGPDRPPDPSLSEVAEGLDVSPDTLRRWTREGIVPLRDGRWSPAAIAQARIVARLRQRGHSLEQVREAARTGRLAYGYMEELFPPATGAMSLRDAADVSGLEPALIRRIWTAAGFSSSSLEDGVPEDDVQLLRYMAAVLSAGFPLVAFLQIVRVYGQTLAQIADAEVKLFHLFVHEPLIRDGVDGLEIAEEMEGLASQLLPLAAPIMEHVHQRWLQHFIEQDVVGHLELEVDGDADLGRLRVGIAFADLAGYTRLTEEAGEEEAFDVVERFLERVEETLPEDARVIKTIGDEVMVVGQDVGALTDWAVEFQKLYEERPEPRIGLHYGATLYRDGDYFGREVNLASRVVARARGGEVIVTDSVVEQVSQSEHLTFEGIGQVKLKGFDQPRQLCRASVPANG
jgi:adenylate cyclase